MNLTQNSLRLFAAALCAAGLLAGCGGGGDIEISSDDNSVINDNSTSGGGGGSSNPCANYTDPASNTLQQGAFDGENCTYSSNFVGENTPLTVDLTIPLISGVHIFEDTLQVGVNQDSGAAPACGPDPSVDDCDGPTLTIRAGNTLAWTQASDYLLVNRGSRMIAEGSSSAPITLTGFQDAVSGSAGPEAVQLWGGLVINGNGITNKCDDAQRASDSCHVLGEGKPSNYGGDDNTESSGILQYVVVKHTGFEVAPGDELNGMTFNGVGSGTVVENVEAFSTFDDGFEFFGGAVTVSNLVAIFVKDDSIDYADGWVGSVSNALVIHAQRDGNRCIEGDNQSPTFAAVPLTNPTVSNMTCITSGTDQPPGTHGDSEGVLLRAGVASTIVDSIITDQSGVGGTNPNDGAGNECFEFNDAETAANAFSNTTVLKSTLIYCAVPTQGDLTPSSTDTTAQWVLNTGTGSYAANTNNIIMPNTTNAAVVLDGIFTATTILDEAGAPVTVTPEGDFIGAVVRTDDWTANWTFGLNVETLGFEPRP